VGWVYLGLGAFLIVVELFLVTLTMKRNPASLGSPAAWLNELALSLGGLGTGAFGICELRGVMSRVRWRRAEAQVSRLSTLHAIRWHHHRGNLIGPGFFLLFSGAALVRPPLSLPWILGSIAAVGSLYVAALVAVNVREIRWEGNTVVYSSRPIRHPFDRTRCENVRCVYPHIDNSQTTYALFALSEEGSTTQLTTVDSAELAITLADAVNASMPPAKI